MVEEEQNSGRTSGDHTLRLLPASGPAVYFTLQAPLWAPELLHNILEAIVLSKLARHMLFAMNIIYIH